MTTWQFLLLAGLLIAIVALLALVLLRANNSDKNSDDFEELQDELVRLAEQVESTAKTNAEFNTQLRAEISGSLRDGRQEQREQLFSSSKLQTETLINMKDSIVSTLSDSMDRLQASNEARLDRIQGVVDEKLDRERMRHKATAHEGSIGGIGEHGLHLFLCSLVGQFVFL